MMMAHDSHANGPRLSAEAVADLQRALDTYVSDQQADGLQRCLQRTAVEARERKMHAEQLLLALKDVWYGLPHLQDKAGEEQTRLLQRVVSMCIREYYGG